MIKQYIFAPAENHRTPLSSLKLAENRYVTLLRHCDVKMSRKNCKHLFSYLVYIFLQENVCLTLLPKNSHGITQRPTLNTWIHSPTPCKFTTLLGDPESLKFTRLPSEHLMLHPQKAFRWRADDGLLIALFPYQL